MVQASQWGVPTSGQVSPVDYATRDDAALDALLSSHSGNTAPGYAVAGTRWLDTTNGTAWAMKFYDGSDWSIEWLFNPTTNQFSYPNAPSGSVIGSVSNHYTTWAAMTAQIPLDDTIPQITEGTQILSATITPKFQNSIMRVAAFVQAVSFASATFPTVAIFRTGQSNALRSAYVGNIASPIMVEETPNTTSAITYTVRIGPSSAQAIYLNGNTGTRIGGGSAAASLLVEEIKA